MIAAVTIIVMGYVAARSVIRLSKVERINVELTERIQELNSEVIALENENIELRYFPNGRARKEIIT